MSVPLGLAAWLARIEAAHPRGADGIELGLDRVSRVCRQLDQRAAWPVILVGGTNGKGSVCAMLERILGVAGYRVGLYTSPHLLRYNERVRIDQRPVDDSALVRAFERVEVGRRAAGDVALTYFEFGTLAAWEVFAETRPDVVILEVGLGGRLDATNIYPADCCVVTTIDIDHAELLGPDREAIGFEKAGIFRKGVPAVCADAAPPDSLTIHARETGAPLTVLGQDFGYQRQDQQWLFWTRRGGDVVRRGGLAHPGLRGESQLSNASCALQVLEQLRERLPVAMKDVRQGLIETELAGRFQVLPGRPSIVLDVAHNPQAARALASNLGSTGFHPATWAVFGMLADKDVDAVVAPLLERVTHWLPCTLPGRRGATADFLAAAVAAAGGEVAARCPDVASALATAQARANPDDRILAFGSFLTVAAALEALGRTA